MSLEESVARYLAARLPDGGNLRVTNLYRIPGGASRETWSVDASWDTSNGAVTGNPSLPAGPRSPSSPRASWCTGDACLERQPGALVTPCTIQKPRLSHNPGIGNAKGPG